MSINPGLKGYPHYKTSPSHVIKDFFIWRESDVSFSRYLDFCAFMKSTNFKICDVIIDIAPWWKLHLRLFLLNPTYYQNQNSVKYYCAVWQTFLTCFWFNAGDWKLVPGPFMILLKWQYSEICPFLVITFTFFKCPLFTFSKIETLEPWHHWLLSDWIRLLNWKGTGT